MSGFLGSLVRCGKGLGTPHTSMTSGMSKSHSIGALHRAFAPTTTHVNLGGYLRLSQAKRMYWSQDHIQYRLIISMKIDSVSYIGLTRVVLSG